MEEELKRYIQKYTLEILSKRNNRSHIKDLKNYNFEEIDLVIVNFYPFEKTLEQTNNHLKIIENIDVGGPTMVRAGRKKL